jgi:hypothetical protein
MQLTYIDPSGKKTQGAPVDNGKIPVVDTSQTKSTLTSNPPISSQISTTQQNSSQQEEVKLSTESPEAFRKFIEVEVLKIIKKLAEEGKTPEERLRAMARRTLELIKPGMTVEELFQNAAHLDDQFPELSPVVFLVMKEYEQKYEKKALEQVTKLVKLGKYDEAEAIVKRILAYKMIK